MASDSVSQHDGIQPSSNSANGLHSIMATPLASSPRPSLACAASQGFTGSLSSLNHLWNSILTDKTCSGRFRADSRGSRPCEWVEAWHLEARR